MSLTTWGCDVRAGVAAFGSLTDGYPSSTWHASIPEPKLRGAERLRIYREVLGLVLDGATGAPPSAIIIEIPQMHGAAQVVLMTHVGVTMEFLASRFACPILELRTTQWKAMAGIGGGAKKPLVYETACALGLDRRNRPTRQDEADALVMALAARRALDN